MGHRAEGCLHNMHGQVAAARAAVVTSPQGKEQVEGGRVLCQEGVLQALCTCMVQFYMVLPYHNTRVRKLHPACRVPTL